MTTARDAQELGAEPRFLDCGETALSVEFGDAVDPEINARVLALDDALRAAPPKGLRETTPTYRALFLRYEPLEISRATLMEKIRALLSHCVARNSSPAQRGRGLNSAFDKQRWVVPCCYDPSLAEDVNEAAKRLGLSARQLAEQHAGADHRAFMYGFAPGWLYLGEAPAPFRHHSRRARQRRRDRARLETFGRVFGETLAA
ncbi:MAG: allophanate hydrolase subunit 1, partial [Methylocystis sp.]|nr:allophanate hydrolase subunit 1 [Methylocystis sp.]